MKSRSVLVVVGCAAAVLCLVTGCGGGKKKEITELQRKEAAHHASEAQFAMSLRDYARAEASFAKAAALTPDEGAIWVSLGAARVKLGQRDGAKKAYQEALSVYEAEAKEKKTDPEPWLKQAYVLVLLGRKDDGRAVVAQAGKQFPEHRNVKAFIEGKQYDRMLADPKLKEMGI